MEDKAPMVYSLSKMAKRKWKESDKNISSLWATKFREMCPGLCADWKRISRQETE